jgi:hypothetical protein
VRRVPDLSVPRVDANVVDQVAVVKEDQVTWVSAAGGNVADMVVLFLRGTRERLPGLPEGVEGEPGAVEVLRADGAPPVGISLFGRGDTQSPGFDVGGCCRGTGSRQSAGADECGQEQYAEYCSAAPVARTRVGLPGTPSGGSAGLGTDSACFVSRPGTGAWGMRLSGGDHRGAAETRNHGPACPARNGASAAHHDRPGVGQSGAAERCARRRSWGRCAVDVFVIRIPFVARGDPTGAVSAGRVRTRGGPIDMRSPSGSPVSLLGSGSLPSANRACTATAVIVRGGLMRDAVRVRQIVGSIGTGVPIKANE